MESFLRSMGFNAVQRAAAMRAGQVQVIRRRGSDLHITTCDVRGSFELVLPLDARPVEGEGDDPAKPLTRKAFVDGKGDLVITETESGTREPLSVCRRSLREDGRMCVDVRKRFANGDVASMRVVYSRKDARVEPPT